MKKIIDDKKKFEKPILEVVEFTNDDIMTTSGNFGDPTPGGNDVFHPTGGWW